jgi:hypothetical protein
MILYDAIFRLSTWLKNEAAGNNLTLCPAGRQPNSKKPLAFERKSILLPFTISCIYIFSFRLSFPQRLPCEGLVSLVAW